MAMIFTRPVQLGDSVLEGQVVLLDIDTMQYSAPNKRRPWFKIGINAALASQGIDGTDIRPLTDAKFYVIAVLPEGTIDLSKVDES
jgi:hypothetical protein